MPNEIVSSAEGRLVSFRNLKSEIDTDMMVIHERSLAISQKISANIKSEEKPEGLLTRNAQDYLKCLKFGHGELELLFREDDAYWNRSLVSAKIESQKLQEKVQLVLDKY